MLADDVVFEYIITVPDYPRRVEGRQSVIDIYSDYDSYMSVESADNLRVYRDREQSVVILEYEVHGSSVQTGRPYNNRFVSIVTTKNGKVTWWRDYHFDPLAVFEERRIAETSRPELSAFDVSSYRRACERSAIAAATDR